MKLKIKETERAIYASGNFTRESMVHQISATAYDGHLHVEIVPPSYSAKQVANKLIEALGEPEEPPRVRESFSDCGEEPGSLLVSWKGDLKKHEWIEKLAEVLKDE